jgi:hypothetical protein
LTINLRYFAKDVGVFVIKTDCLTNFTNFI